MIEIGSTNDREALTQAASALALVANQLLRALAASPSAVNNTVVDHNTKIETLPRTMPSDPMTLREVRSKLRLTEKQIATLRRLWGFPVPYNGKGYLIFSRSEIETWAKRQPNPDNFAAVLRLRRRDNWNTGRQAPVL